MDRIFLFIVLFLKKLKGDDYRDIITTAYVVFYMVIFFPFFGLILYVDQFLLEGNYTTVETGIQERLIGRLIMLPIVFVSFISLYFLIKKKKRFKYLHYVRKGNSFSKWRLLFYSVVVILLISSLVWLPFFINYIVG